ncbi:MAG: 2-C-methyl-D-erythritol 4-phosphate cytidylyltransferase [Tyzzerella sp.]|nr:2-C-methyl-D-erythritol 4-phosphate cytidylyltransferase [Tyzzerella sp.]
MQKKKCTAIVLAAGQGRRMGTKVQKQYLEIDGKPVLYYSLHTFEQSEIIDEIILVVGDNQAEYCQNEIVSKYGFSKVRRIVQGGAERYISVWNGLQEVDDGGYVFIHDGARPFINEEILNRAYNDVQLCKSCVVGMPVKDTIKLADSEGFVNETPDRSLVWMIQTPQVFESSLVKQAYALLMEQEHIQVTDDAMVVEQMLGHKVKLTMGSYENIKITTPEDLEIAEIFVKNLEK